MFSENQKISERQMARLLIFDMCGISTLLLPGLLGKMLGTDGVFAILLGAVPVYLFTFLPELLQEKRKNSNTSNISNIGKKGSISVRSGVWDTNLMQNRTGDADGKADEKIVKQTDDCSLCRSAGICAGSSFTNAFMWLWNLAGHRRACPGV